MDDLTDEQKQFILENWSRMTFSQLVQATFDDSSLDGRSAQGRMVKRFLGNKELKTSKHVKVEPFILNDNDKEYILANPSMRPIEIARVLLGISNPAPLGREVRAIGQYMKQEGLLSTKDEVVDGEFEPPRHMSQVVAKINRYVPKTWDLKTMTHAERKMAEMLKNFLHSPRFITMINSYVTRTNREIFESEFIRSTFDKPDLSPDELNLYVNLCSNYVLMIGINRQLDMLNERYEQTVSDPDGKISMSLAEMIKVKTDELNKCDKRQSDLIEALSGKRSARKQNQKIDNLSIVRLIEWWREEEERNRAIQLANLQKDEVNKEIDRLESVDQLKARIMGISRSELLNG